MDIEQTLRAYPHTHKPFPQQVEALRRSLSKRRFAYFMDQGTGKSKVVIDTAAILFQKRVIEALLIIAPNDVHAQWLDEQIPEHLPPSIAKPVCALWRASSARRERECVALTKYKPKPKELPVLSMNHDAFATTRGRRVAVAFLKRFKCLVAVDESDLCLHTPKALRTRGLQHEVSDRAVVKRIMTGTPASNPFDLFAPFRFLDERILGFDSLLAFKHRYAKWEEHHTHVHRKKGKHAGQTVLQTYEELIEYQNIDELNAKIAPFVYKVRKEDCLDLPPKLYAKRRTHLSKTQRALYDELKEQGLLLLDEAVNAPDGDGVAGDACRAPVHFDKLADLTEDELLSRMQASKFRTTAEIKLTLLLRLHQIVGGFITSDERVTRAIDGHDTPVPRMLDTLRLVQGALTGTKKVIVWAVFRAELDALTRWCKEQFGKDSTVCIHGGVKGKEREDALLRFKLATSSTRVLVAHPRSVGTGFNFTVANTLIYYSCGASGRDRMQSEDRAHRIGQTDTVSIYDLDCPDVPIDRTMRELREAKQTFNASVMTWDATTVRSKI